jgi:nucleoside-diphosphate-sugar epimerase
LKILVTGANGFIGSALMRALVQRHEVIGVVRDSMNLSSKYRLIDDICNITADDLSGITCVVHAAGVAETGADEAELQRVNVEGARHLAIACRDANVSQLVNLSSVKASGEGCVGPDSPDQPTSAYGRSKLLAEDEINSVIAGSNTKIVHLRFPLVYGPGAQNSFLKLIYLSSSRCPLPLASLSAQRSYCFIENLTRMVELQLRSGLAVPIVYIADQSPKTLPAMLIGIGRAIGRQPMLIPFPESLMKFVVKIIKPKSTSQLFDSSVVDISSTRKYFKDWNPMSTEDALKYLEFGRDGRI